MSNERMFDLSFEILDDGMIDLEQSTGAGEAVSILLHPVQLRLLAERAGLLEPSLQVPQPLVTEAHQRRVRALHGRIDELYNNESFFNDIWDRCGDAQEWWLHIRSIHEMAEELDADLVDATEPSDENPRNDNSVTEIPPKSGKRGRPPTGEAKTNAERQQAHRERKAGESQLEFKEIQQ